MKEVDLDAVLRQRGWPARRWLMVVLVGVLVLVTASGVIATVNPGVPAALGAMLFGTPIPTATIGPGGNIAYYENGVPWGALTVDNRSIPINATPKPIFLGRGRHTLSYRADPFPLLRCTISTPAAASDTCPLDATFASRLGIPASGARAVDLGSTLERLPAPHRDALVAVIRSQVEYTSTVTVVRPGEHYSDTDRGRITLETATQPLNVTLRTRLWDANAQVDSMSGFPTCVVCLPLSNASMGSEATAFPNLLEVWAHVDTGYHYTTQDGRVVRDFAPLRQEQQAAVWGPDSSAAFLVGWNGQWQITSPRHDNTTLPCQSGFGDLLSSVDQEKYAVTGSRPAPNLTDGCLLVVRHIVRQQSSASASGPPILFLERFGVLLAVGDAAHQVCPTFPVASQAEVDEAYAIAAQGPLP